MRGREKERWLEREIEKIREEAILTKKANDSSVRGRERERVNNRARVRDRRDEIL